MPDLSDIFGDDVPSQEAPMNAGDPVDVATVVPMESAADERAHFASLVLVGTGPDGTEIRARDADGLPSHYFALLPKPGVSAGPDAVECVELHCDIFDSISVLAALDHAETGHFPQDPARALAIPALPDAIDALVCLGALTNGYCLYAMRVGPDAVAYLTEECGGAFVVADTTRPTALVRAAVAIADARIQAGREVHQALVEDAADRGRDRASD